MAVELPITARHDKKSDDNKDLIVSVTASGDIYFGRRQDPLERLTTAVREERTAHHPTTRASSSRPTTAPATATLRKAMSLSTAPGSRTSRSAFDEKQQGAK